MINPKPQKWEKRAKVKLRAAATLTGAKAAVANAAGRKVGATSKALPKRKAQVVTNEKLLKVLRGFKGGGKDEVEGGAGNGKGKEKRRPSRKGG